MRNRDEIFPPMLAAIRGARKTINFETYIYWSGDIGRAFADALTERARAGVKAHALLDCVGSAKMADALLDEMRNAGVQIRKYHPPHWTHLGRLNNRTHRKLLVVDGTIGFAGGVGIAPSWTVHARDPDHWRDTHFEVEGPLVGQIQAVFLDNWIKVSGEVLHGPDYFPLLAPVGQGRAQMFSSSPTSGSECMALMYLLAITSAAHSIDLSASYFVPDDFSARLARGDEARRPGAHRRARRAHRFGAGAQRLERQMGAAPVGRCDDRRIRADDVPLQGHDRRRPARLGRLDQLDNRSFRLNDEAMLNIMDAVCAAAQTAVFEADLENSRRIDYAAWAARPWKERFAERFASLISAQL